MIVGSVKFNLVANEDPHAFWLRVSALIERAAMQDCAVVVFPELTCLSLSLDTQKELTLAHRLASLDAYRETFFQRAQALAKAYKLPIVMGSLPFHTNAGSVMERCYTFLPDEQIFEQDKAHVTPFDQEVFGLSAGRAALSIFTIDRVVCAVVLGYDIELPRLAALAGHNNVQVLFVPTMAHSETAAFRLEHCARSRAIETQSFVVMAGLCGELEDRRQTYQLQSPTAIFAPCEPGIADLGLLSRASASETGDCLLVERLDLHALSSIRKAGEVRTHQLSKQQSHVDVTFVGR